MSEQHRVYLGLGTNMGDRPGNLAQALCQVRVRAAIEKVSNCYETKPVGYLEQPDFINIACLIMTDLSPHELMRFLQQIETGMGRKSSFRNAPRTIDLDILLYDDLVLLSTDLTIPHPRLLERAFVLAPLAEIAAELEHPTLHLTVNELFRRVGSEGVVKMPLAT